MDPNKKRKAFGQHFLKDKQVCSRIVDEFLTEAEKNKIDTILEIGPGRGALTIPLFESLEKSGFIGGKIQKIYIAEKDRELIALWTEWKNKQSYGDKITILGADFLHLDQKEWATSENIGILSNLPYSAGTAITLDLLELTSQVKIMVLMFQAEVAKRLRAVPGNSDWGSLSIWCQNRWDIKKLIGVPPKAFAPPPKVDSEVATFHPRPETLLNATNMKLLNSLLKTSFAHRRKMLRSGLPKTGHFKQALENAGIDGQLRPEQLDWDDWRRFYSEFEKLHVT